MSESPIDYLAVFESLPVPLLLLRPDFTMIAANEAYCRISGRSRQELTGQGVFDAFPDNPSEPGVSGPEARRVAAPGNGHWPTGRMACSATTWRSRGNLAPSRSATGARSTFLCVAADGEVDYIIHLVEEVPELIRKFVDAESAGA